MAKIISTSEISGYYGSGRTPCTVFTATDSDGGTWYIVEGAQMANYTFDNVEDGVNVEELEDIDCFTVNNPIIKIEQLESHICDYVG